MICSRGFQLRRLILPLHKPELELQYGGIECGRCTEGGLEGFDKEGTDDKCMG